MYNSNDPALALDYFTLSFGEEIFTTTGEKLSIITFIGSCNLVSQTSQDVLSPSLVKLEPSQILILVLSLKEAKYGEKKILDDGCIYCKSKVK